MKNILCRLWRDERGVIISAELVLVMTIAVLAMVVGLHGVAKAVVHELNDLAGAFGALNQTFFFGGLVHPGHAAVTGAGFIDRIDFCDCMAVVQVPPFPHVGGFGVGAFGAGAFGGGAFGGGAFVPPVGGGPVPGAVIPPAPAIDCPHGVSPCPHCTPALPTDPHGQFLPPIPNDVGDAVPPLPQP